MTLPTYLPILSLILTSARLYVSTPSLLPFVIAAVFFGTYEHTKRVASTHVSSEYAWAGHMTAASAGEITTAVVRMPFEIVKQQLQAGAHGSARDCVRHILVTQGPTGFWKGYFSLVLREVPFSLIQFPLYELAKSAAASHWGSADAVPGWALSLCGSAAGGAAAAITTPLDVAKTRLLLEQTGDGVVTTMKKVHAEGGVKALWAGVVPRVTWISIGGAVFFGTYEQAKRFLVNRFGGLQQDAEGEQGK